jgi:hypothetical protein
MSRSVFRWANVGSELPIYFWHFSKTISLPGAKFWQGSSIQPTTSPSRT